MIIHSTATGIRKTYSIGVAAGDGKSLKYGIGLFVIDTLNDVQVAGAVYNSGIRIGGSALEVNSFTQEIDGFVVRVGIDENGIAIGSSDNSAMDGGLVEGNIEGIGKKARACGQKKQDRHFRNELKLWFIANHSFLPCEC